MARKQPTNFLGSLWKAIVGGGATEVPAKHCAVDETVWVVTPSFRDIAACAWPCSVIARSTDVAPLQLRRFGDGAEFFLAEASPLVAWDSEAHAIVTVFGAIAASHVSSAATIAYLRAVREAHSAAHPTDPSPPRPFFLAWLKLEPSPLWPCVVLPPAAAAVLCDADVMSECTDDGEAMVIFLGAPATWENDFASLDKLRNAELGPMRRTDMGRAWRGRLALRTNDSLSHLLQSFEVAVECGLNMATAVAAVWDPEASTALVPAARGRFRLGKQPSNAADESDHDSDVTAERDDDDEDGGDAAGAAGSVAGEKRPRAEAAAAAAAAGDALGRRGSMSRFKSPAEVERRRSLAGQLRTIDAPPHYKLSAVVTNLHAPSGLLAELESPAAAAAARAAVRLPRLRRGRVDLEGPLIEATREVSVVEVDAARFADALLVFLERAPAARALSWPAVLCLSRHDFETALRQAGGGDAAAAPAAARAAEPMLPSSSSPAPHGGPLARQPPSRVSCSSSDGCGNAAPTWCLSTCPPPLLPLQKSVRATFAAAPAAAPPHGRSPHALSSPPVFTAALESAEPTADNVAAVRAALAAMEARLKEREGRVRPGSDGTPRVCVAASHPRAFPSAGEARRSRGCRSCGRRYPRRHQCPRAAQARRGRRSGARAGSR